MRSIEDGGGIRGILDQQRCIDEIFNGDKRSFNLMRDEVDRLVQFWLDWLTYDNGELPAFTRLDFLASYTPDQTPPVRVWTGEVCEIGVSICVPGEQRSGCERNWIFDACLERQLRPAKMEFALSGDTDHYSPEIMKQFAKVHF